MAIKLVSYNGGLYAVNYNGGLGAIYEEEETPVVVARTITFSGYYGTWSNSSLTAYDGDYLTSSNNTVTCKIGGSSGNTRWTNTFYKSSNTSSNLYKLDSFSGIGTVNGNKTVTANVTAFSLPMSYNISTFGNAVSSSTSDLDSKLQNYGAAALDGTIVNRMLLDTDIFVGFNICQMSSDYLCGFIFDDGFDSPIAQDDIIIRINNGYVSKSYWCCRASTNPDGDWPFVIMDGDTEYLVISSNDSDMLYDDIYNSIQSVDYLINNVLMNNDDVVFVGILTIYSGGSADLAVYKS